MSRNEYIAIRDIRRQDGTEKFTGDETSAYCEKDELNQNDSESGRTGLRSSNKNWYFVIVSSIVTACIVIIFSRGLPSFILGSSSNTYDYIVVGGGPAGSVMTRKLVDSGATVLLLEAGAATQVIFF